MCIDHKIHLRHPTPENKQGTTTLPDQIRYPIFPIQHCSQSHQNEIIPVPLELTAFATAPQPWSRPKYDLQSLLSHGWMHWQSRECNAQHADLRDTTTRQNFAMQYKALFVVPLVTMRQRDRGQDSLVRGAHTYPLHRRLWSHVNWYAWQLPDPCTVQRRSLSHTSSKPHSRIDQP